jgi:hypothetical protein
MPRFYLRVRKAEGVAADEVGVELPDLQAAHREAVQTVEEMISEAALHGHPVEPHHRVEIADGTRKLLMTVPFADGANLFPFPTTDCRTLADEQEGQPSSYWYAWFAGRQARMTEAAKAKLR